MDNTPYQACQSPIAHQLPDTTWQKMLFLLLMLVQLGPSNSGELRVSVADPAGQPLQSHVELVSEVNQVRERLETDARGLLVAPGLPFGRYRMVVARDGFAPFVTSVDVSSALPRRFASALALAGVQAKVTVRPEEPLLDPHGTDSVSRIGADMLRQRVAALPVVAGGSCEYPAGLAARGERHPSPARLRVSDTVCRRRLADYR